MRLEDLLTRAPLVVHKGVYDFIGARPEDYCENFGEQWKRFREIQLDSVQLDPLSRVHSHTRFFAETAWSRDELKGKLLLDAGCGAGRFAEVALEAGAQVVAVDMSEAVWACRQTLERFPRDEWLILRGDICGLPLSERIFDGVYSLGVLHHTPDPLAAVGYLARFLAPGGRLATWIYERRCIRWLEPTWLIRNAVRRWPLRYKLSLAKALTTVFFPVGWTLSWLGRVGEITSRFLPYVARHHFGRGDFRRQWNYSVMDTFDYYGPVYNQLQREIDVVQAMRAAGLINVRRLRARGMAIVAEAPLGPRDSGENR